MINVKSTLPETFRRRPRARAALWAGAVLAAAAAAGSAGCADDLSCPLAVDIDGDGVLDEADCEAQREAATVAALCRLEPELWRTADACAYEASAREPGVELVDGEGAIRAGEAIGGLAHQSAFVAVTRDGVRTFTSPRWSEVDGSGIPTDVEVGPDWTVQRAAGAFGTKVVDMDVTGGVLAVATDSHLWFDADHDHHVAGSEMIDVRSLSPGAAWHVAQLQEAGAAPTPVLVTTTPANGVVAWRDADHDMRVGDGETLSVLARGSVIGTAGPLVVVEDDGAGGAYRTWSMQDWVADAAHLTSSLVDRRCRQVVGWNACTMGDDQVISYGDGGERADRVGVLPLHARDVSTRADGASPARLAVQYASARVGQPRDLKAWVDGNGDLTLQPDEVATVSSARSILGGAITFVPGPRGSWDAVYAERDVASGTVDLVARHRRPATRYLGEDCAPTRDHCAMGLTCRTNGGPTTRCVVTARH